MTVWTLWLVLVMNDGTLSIMEAREFLRESSCKEVANYARSAEISGARKVIPVCKASTKV